jgi:hypothetical protein
MPYVNYNWAGYATTLPTVNPYRGTYAVHAEWFLPQVDCPFYLGDGYSFSPWVGLGGYGPARPLAQTGVRILCSGGVASFAAWREYIFHSMPSTPAEQPRYWPAADTPMRAGDHMIADVWDFYGTYNVRLLDVTAGWRAPLSDSMSLCSDMGICAALQGTTAEVVIEGHKAFPIYSSLQFFNTWVKVAPTSWSWLYSPLPFGSLDPDALSERFDLWFWGADIPEIANPSAFAQSGWQFTMFLTL